MFWHRLIEKEKGVDTMYPYNKPALSPKTPLEVKQSMNQPNHKDSIKEDKRLEKILVLSEKEALDLMRRYQKMMNIDLLQKSKSLTKTMYLDEMKHLKSLQEALYILGKTSPVPQIELDTTMNFSPKELIEDTLLLEMDNGNFYQNLSSSMPQGELKTIFDDIAWDKQTDATSLCYLFSKYFC